MFEVAVGLKIVEDSRYEAWPVASSVYLSGVGGNEAQSSLFVFGNENAEHLALGGFMFNLLEIRRMAERGDSPFAEGMWRIAERVVHSFRAFTAVVKKVEKGDLLCHGNLCQEVYRKKELEYFLQLLLHLFKIQAMGHDASILKNDVVGHGTEAELFYDGTVKHQSVANGWPCDAVVLDD